MGTSNDSCEFRRDRAHQITVRGYPGWKVSRRCCPTEEKQFQLARRDRPTVSWLTPMPVQG